MIGFVILHRDITDWEWYHHPTVSRLYFHLILKVNFKDNEWQGITVQRGQLVTSVNSLSAELKLSSQQIRTALTKLEEGSYIEKRATNNFTFITLVNYDKFQSADYDVNKRKNNPIINEQQSNNIPLTTTKQGNKEKINNKTIELRKEKFKIRVFEHSQFSKDILNGFFNYWSELNSETNKMRWEKDGYFEISSRLEKWFENERPKNPPKSNYQPTKQSNKSVFQSNR